MSDSAKLRHKSKEEMREYCRRQVAAKALDAIEHPETPQRQKEKIASRLIRHGLDLLDGHDLSACINALTTFAPTSGTGSGNGGNQQPPQRQRGISIDLP